MSPLHVDEYLRLCTQIPGPGVPGVPIMLPPPGPIGPGGPVVPGGPVGPFLPSIPQGPVDPVDHPVPPGEALSESQSGVATEVPCIICDKCSHRGSL